MRHHHDGEHQPDARGLRGDEGGGGELLVALGGRVGHELAGLRVRIAGDAHVRQHDVVGEGEVVVAEGFAFLCDAGEAARGGGGAADRQVEAKLHDVLRCHCRRDGRRGAGVIEKLLAGAPVAGCRRGVAGEQHETVLALEAIAYHHQRLMRHVGARAGNAVREQDERVGRAEFRLFDPHRHVVVTDQRHREARPMRSDRRRVFAQCRAHVETHAVDMDMQLVLRAAAERVDRQPDRVARQMAVRAVFDEGARVPGVSPVVRRVRGKDVGAFDAAQARGRDEQVLRVADEVLQHSIAAAEVDLGAGYGRVILLLVRHALFAHDVPERVGIGGCRARRGDDCQGGEDRCTPDTAPQPPPQRRGGALHLTHLPFELPLPFGEGGGVATIPAPRRVAAHPRRLPSCRFRDPPGSRRRSRPSTPTRATS